MEWIYTKLLDMKYMKANEFVLQFMCMYRVPQNTHWTLKGLFYLWRFVCLFGLSSLAVLCLLDVYLRENYVFVDISSNILNTGIFLGGCTRVVYFYWHDAQSKVIVEQMNLLFEDTTETRMWRERTMKYYKMFTLVFTVYWSCVVFFTGEFTAFLPLAFLEKNGKTLSIQAHYPYDWKSHGWYELTFFSQALTQSFMGFAYGNPDMFYVCSLILTAGQFKMLAWEFENVVFSSLIDYGFGKDSVYAFSRTFNGFRVDARGMRDGSDGDVHAVSEVYVRMLDAIRTQEFEALLKARTVRCVKRHQMLLDFCKLLNEFFAPLLLPCLSFGLFYIIFIAFTLLVSTDRSSFMGLTEYLVTAVVEVFLMSLFGQILTNESDEIREAMYRSPWYLCSSNYLSIFKYSHMKSTESVVIKAGSYFTMKLELFIAISKTAGSYFAFLRQVTE